MGLHVYDSALNFDLPQWVHGQSSQKPCLRPALATNIPLLVACQWQEHNACVPAGHSCSMVNLPHLPHFSVPFFTSPKSSCCLRMCRFFFFFFFSLPSAHSLLLAPSLCHRASLRSGQPHSWAFPLSLCCKSPQCP